MSAEQRSMIHLPLGATDTGQDDSDNIYDGGAQDGATGRHRGLTFNSGRGGGGAGRGRPGPGRKYNPPIPLTAIRNEGTDMGMGMNATPHWEQGTLPDENTTATERRKRCMGCGYKCAVM